MGIFDKVKAMAAGNPDKANSIIDRIGDLVDQKTGGKHAEHVDKGQEFLRGQVGGQPQAPANPPPVQKDAPPPGNPPV